MADDYHGANDSEISEDAAWRLLEKAEKRIAELELALKTTMPYGMSILRTTPTLDAVKREAFEKGTKAQAELWKHNYQEVLNFLHCDTDPGAGDGRRLRRLHEDGERLIGELAGPAILSDVPGVEGL